MTGKKTQETPDGVGGQSDIFKDGLGELPGETALSRRVGGERMSKVGTQDCGSPT